MDKNRILSDFDTFVETDPTLNYFMRDAQLDSKLLMHQVDIRIAVTKNAIAAWLEYNYPTKP